MGIRRHFEGVACARFGDGDQTEEKSPRNSKMDGIDALRKENADLRQRIGRLELELVELRGTKKPDNKKSAGPDNKKSASSKSGRGRPAMSISDEERQERRRKQFADANRKRRNPT